MVKLTVLICALSFSLTVLADGQDGQAGVNGMPGAVGSSGNASVNFIPLNATSSYPLYLPILNCEPFEAQTALKNGSNINSPIYTSKKITPLSVALIQGCDAVLKILLENENIYNKPNFELDMFESDGSKFNFYSALLIGNNPGPHIAVRTNALERIRIILPFIQDYRKLIEATSDVIEVLISAENKYSSYPTNLEVVSLIQNRTQELRSKNID